jgi:hypothetical protein
MANGAVVRLPLVTPEPTSAKPTAPPAATAIQVGEAVADAVEALGAALADLDAGGLTAANRARGGVTVAAVVELQLTHFGAFDFGALALVEGKRILHARHGAVLHRQLGTDAGIDDVFGDLLSHILAVATEVTATEMAFRAH